MPRRPLPLAAAVLAVGGAPATDARDQVPDALEEAIAASEGQAGANPGEPIDMPEGGGSSLRRAEVLEGGRGKWVTV